MVKNTASNAVSTEANDFDPTIANEIVLRKEEFNEIRRKLSPQDEGFPIVEVVNYNEREEAIIIEVAIIIKANWVKRLLVVPLLSLLTIFIFPIFLYWRADMRAQWFYSTVQTLDDATNILIVGREKNFTIVRLENKAERCKQLLVEEPELNQFYAKNDCRMFTYRFTAFMWQAEASRFEPVRYSVIKTFNEILNDTEHMTDKKREFCRILYGPGEILVPTANIFLLIINELMNPFYMFQIFALGIWYWEEYTTFAIVLSVLALFSITSTVFDLVMSNRRVVKLAKYSCDVELRTKEGFKTVNSGDLVPGDVIKIPTQIPLPVDMLAVSGISIVNEALLSGESIPVIKQNLPKSDDQYDESMSKHTLYAGTTVITNKEVDGNAVTGLVIRTGFQTQKGSLVKDILFPKPFVFQFQRDVYKFIFILGAISLIGFFIVIPGLKANIDPDETENVNLEIFQKLVDSLTIAVPPSLIASMNFGMLFALARLRLNNIFCIQQARVILAARIQTFVFDKTGTLTGEGLSVLGARATNTMNTFEEFQTDIQKLAPSDFKAGRSEKTNNAQLLEAMATCHAVSWIQTGTDADGKPKLDLVGDPLDVQMFLSTGWVLNEENATATIQQRMNPANSDFELCLLRRFDFKSDLMRASVLVMNQNQQVRSFVKGAPERLKELCNTSTVPTDYDKINEYYTLNGYRVIALATKDMEGITCESAQQCERSQVESELSFLGFLVMENKLKPETTGVIEVLHNAEVRCVMATGDNLLTAMSVARQCKIIDEKKKTWLGDYLQQDDGSFHVKWTDVSVAGSGEKFEVEGLPIPESASNRVADGADNGKLPWNYKDTTIELVISGKLMRYLYNHRISEGYAYKAVLARANVFGRMAPDDKAMLVLSFQTALLDQKIGMCGDGANDCAALKQADAGISLSQAEASIAAPFTCSKQDIECVPTLLREGKASLATAFQIAKFTISYAMIQYFQVILLYYIGMSMTNNGFLYEDLVALIPFAIFQSLTKAYPKLTKELPTESLFYLPEFLSLGGQIAIMWSVQLALYLTVAKEPWYQNKINTGGKAIVDQNWVSYEYAVLWIVCNFQFIISVIIFNSGPPFRAPLYTNILFTLCLIVVFAADMVWVFLPFKLGEGEKNPFDLLDYKDVTTGKVYYSYRWMLFITIVVMSIANALTEWVLIRRFTKWMDARNERKRHEKFEAVMKKLSTEQA